MPPRIREEARNGTRVLIKVGYYGFDDVAGLAFDQIRRAAFTGGQVAVLERYLEIVGRAIDANKPPERRRALWVRAFAVARLAPSQVSDPRDAAELVLGTVKTGERLLEAGVDISPDLERLSQLSEGLPGDERIREAAESALRGAAR